MKYISSEVLKDDINRIYNNQIVSSKYELVMLVSKRAKQISDLAIERGMTEIIKPITMAIDELYEGKVKIEKVNM